MTPPTTAHEWRGKEKKKGEENGQDILMGVERETHTHRVVMVLHK
jgi:hypothetical protein